MHDDARRTPGAQLPADGVGSADGPDPAAMDAVQVAPGARAGQVVSGIASPRRTELDVVGRDIAPIAHRAGAAEAVADVDVTVRHVRAEEMAPGVPDRQAKEPNPAHT